MTWTSISMNDELKQLKWKIVTSIFFLIEISCSSKMSNFLINSISIFQVIIVNNNDRHFSFSFSFVIKAMLIKIINIHNNLVISSNNWNINNSIIDLLNINNKNISQTITVKTINFQTLAFCRFYRINRLFRIDYKSSLQQATSRSIRVSNSNRFNRHVNFLNYSTIISFVMITVTTMTINFVFS